jgi:hypothetical protein
MPACTVCNHPDMHTIDLAILNDNLSLEALGRKFGTSKSAMWRHKRHFEKKIQQAQKRLEASVQHGYLFKLNTLLEDAMDTVKTSRGAVREPPLGDAKLLSRISITEGTKDHKREGG